MALVSSFVAAGQKILADHFNKLRQDLVNHGHGSGEGGTIDHADLGETGPMSGRTYDHEDIDDHIDATDNIHGLPGGVKFPGCGPNQTITVAGKKAYSSSDLTIYLAEDGDSPADIILDSVLSIQLTCHGPTGSSTQHAGIPEVTGNYNNVTGSFTFRVDGLGADPAYVYFTVVGKKS